MRHLSTAALLPVLTLGASLNAQAISLQSTVFSDVGANAAAIQDTVDAFRAALGALNAANGPCTGACVPGVGRREVNWDGVPDSSSSPDAFAGNFFNQVNGSAAPRVRGINFSTSGTFEVSADDDNPTVTATLFGNRHPDNPADFAAFSAQRIFGINGSNQMDVTFSIPGSPGTPAVVRGFGAVFTDVELAGAVSLEFFDVNNNSLGVHSAPAFVFSGGDSFDSFSFVGAVFESALVSRVHIINGGYDLGLNLLDATRNDTVAMDDFIFGEPTVVPLPPAAWLLGTGIAALLVRRRQLTV